MKTKTAAADAADTSTTDGETAAAAPERMVRVTNHRRGTWRLDLDADTKIEIAAGGSELVPDSVWQRALKVSVIRDSLTSRQLACAYVDGVA